MRLKNKMRWRKRKKKKKRMNKRSKKEVQVRDVERRDNIDSVSVSGLTIIIMRREESMVLNTNRLPH